MRPRGHIGRVISALFVVTILGFGTVRSQAPPCIVLALTNISCAGHDVNVCFYPFTLTVTNNTGVAGTMTLSAGGGGVVPPTYQINPGVNTISGTAQVPCGSTLLVLSSQFPLQPPPKMCGASLDVPLPACPC